MTKNQSPPRKADPSVKLGKGLDTAKSLQPTFSEPKQTYHPSLGLRARKGKQPRLTTKSTEKAL